MPEVAEVHGFADVVNASAGRRFLTITKSPVHKREDCFSPLSLSNFSVSAKARGKEMILALHNNDSGSSSFFLFKFGMTGSFKYMARGKAVHKHAHVIMKDREGGHLCFVDSRRFGSWAPCKSMDDWGADRGPDPVDEFEEFCKNVALKVTPKSKFWNKPICEVLLLQEVFNGIGNYLRSEVLHEAGVLDPFRKTGLVFADLTPDNCLDNTILKLCRSIPMRFIERQTYKNKAFLAACAVYQRSHSLSRKDSNGRMVWWKKSTSAAEVAEGEKEEEVKKKRPAKKAAKKAAKKPAKSIKRERSEDDKEEATVIKEKKPTARVAKKSKSGSKKTEAVIVVEETKVTAKKSAPRKKIASSSPAQRSSPRLKK